MNGHVRRAIMRERVPAAVSDAAGEHLIPSSQSAVSTRLLWRIGPGTPCKCRSHAASQNHREIEAGTIVLLQAMQVMHAGSSLCLCLYCVHRAAAGRRCSRLLPGRDDKGLAALINALRRLFQEEEGSAVLATLAAALNARENWRTACTKHRHIVARPADYPRSGRDAITQLLFYSDAASRPHPSHRLRRPQPQRHCCPRSLHPDAVTTNAPGTSVRQHAGTPAT